MAGAIPGSDLAERTAGLSSPASEPVRAKRWRRLRRLARARLAPFGAAVMLLAVPAALAAPLLAPYGPLAQNLCNTPAPPGPAPLLGPGNVGRGRPSPVVWGKRGFLGAGLLPGAFAILAEASLSFLGLGIQPPQASWGSMINAGRGYLQQAPWIVFGPGAALFVTVVGLNFVGDAVRDALDPRMRG